MPEQGREPSALAAVPQFWDDPPRRALLRCRSHRWWLAAKRHWRLVINKVILKNLVEPGQQNVGRDAKTTPGQPEKHRPREVIAIQPPSDCPGPAPGRAYTGTDQQRQTTAVHRARHRHRRPQRPRMSRRPAKPIAPATRSKHEIVPTIASATRPTPGSSSDDAGILQRVPRHSRPPRTPARSATRALHHLDPRTATSSDNTPRLPVGRSAGMGTR